MKTLMFGWEFPPHISGGLGTACFGLTSELLQQGVDVLFVVPKLFGEEDRSIFRLLSASDVRANFDDPGYRELISNLQYIEVSSAILPYMCPEIFEMETSESQVVGAGFTPALAMAGVNAGFTRAGVNPAPTTQFKFSGQYGKDLMKEVAQYAVVAAEIAQQQQFDVIHAHDWLTFPAGLVAKEVSGKPLVVHVHATEYDRSGEKVNPAVFEIEKEGLTGADCIITVSALTKQILIEKYGIPGHKISVVHNGVLAMPENGNEAETEHEKIHYKVVTFLGRITFQKGPKYFVQAAKKVLDKMPDVRFVMAGNGDLLPQMIRQVAKLKMGSRFHFTGFLQGKDTEAMYAMSDVYVMPSVSEPFGIAPLEAIRSGVPVIISRQSGVAEVLKHAIKIDYWDVDSLANAIYGLLNYKPLSQIFIREGNKEVEELKWMDAALKVKTLYQSLLEAPAL